MAAGASSAVRFKAGALERELRFQHACDHPSDSQSRRLPRLRPRRRWHSFARRHPIRGEYWIPGLEL